MVGTGSDFRYVIQNYGLRSRSRRPINYRTLPVIHVLNMLHLKSTAILKDTMQKRQIFCISIFIPELRTLFLSLIGVPEEPRILRTLRFATNLSLSRSQLSASPWTFVVCVLCARFCWESGTTHTLKIREVLTKLAHRSMGANFFLFMENMEG